MLAELVDEVSKIMENPELREAVTAGLDMTASDTMIAGDTVVGGSMVFKGEADSGTMVVNSGTMVVNMGEDETGTMVFNSGGSDAGTMVVNRPDGDDGDGTMVFKAKPGHDTGNMVPAHPTDATLKPGEPGYQPAFMQYFAGKDGGAACAAPGGGGGVAGAASHPPSAQRAPLSAMSIEGLRKRLDELEPEKEREIEALRKRYQAKRRPIEEALKAKQTASS